MFQLNPFRLEYASLLHFLMLQGMALLAYWIYHLYYSKLLARLLAHAKALQDKLDALNTVEPVVTEVHQGTGHNDLKELAGINLKTESILNNVGIYRFDQLAQTPIGNIRNILANHGPLLHNYDPQTWPAQAHLAANGRWTELRKWQEQMRRGQHDRHELKRLTP